MWDVGLSLDVPQPESDFQNYVIACHVADAELDLNRRTTISQCSKKYVRLGTVLETIQRSITELNV
jgi:hypothetical protein